MTRNLLSFRVNTCICFGLVRVSVRLRLCLSAWAERLEEIDWAVDSWCDYRSVSVKGMGRMRDANTRSEKRAAAGRKMIENGRKNGCKNGCMNGRKNGGQDLPIVK
jgi:hypothetical protein